MVCPKIKLRHLWLCEKRKNKLHNTTSQKRKQVPIPFTFPATKLCISLHAPIETRQKQASTVTNVPIWKTNKEVSYNLSVFICGVKEEGLSTDEDDEGVDE